MRMHEGWNENERTKIRERERTRMRWRDGMRMNGV